VAFLVDKEGTNSKGRTLEEPADDGDECDDDVVVVVVVVVVDCSWRPNVWNTDSFHGLVEGVGVAFVGGVVASIVDVEDSHRHDDDDMTWCDLVVGVDPPLTEQGTGSW